MDFAIIRTGGKQYIVTQGQSLEVEKILGDVGASTQFSDVLLVATGDQISIGTPTLPGAIVEGNVEVQDRSDKITVIKYKPKTRYRRKHGHRQAFTKVKITNITLK